MAYPYDNNTPPLAASATDRRRQSRQALLNSSEHAVTPVANRQLAGSPISLISSGLQGIGSRAQAISNRPAEQANLDRANALRLEQQQYDRGQAQQAFDYAREQDALRNALQRQELQGTQDYRTQVLEGQAADRAATAGYRADVLAGNQADRDATQQFRAGQLAQLDGQVLTDSRGRPIGTVDRNTGKFYNLSGVASPTLAETGKADRVIDPTTGYDASFTPAQVKAARGAAGNIETADNVLSVIDRIGKSDYKNIGSAGFADLAASRISPTFLPTSLDSKALFDQLGGIGFLENIGSFEGKGALSDAEGRAIRQAYSGIFDENGVKAGLSERELYDQIGTIQQNLQVGRAKAQRIEELGRPLNSKESADIANQTRAGFNRPSWEEYQKQGDVAVQPATGGTWTPTGAQTTLLNKYQ